MKYCPRCEKEKDDDEFRWRNKKQRQPYCIECNKEYSKEHYLKHKEKYLERSIKARQRKTEWWKKLKSTFKCNRCDEDHPATLDFHHLDPNEKEYDVARIILLKSKKTILEEIEKCEVLCANCHRKLHYNGP